MGTVYAYVKGVTLLKLRVESNDPLLTYYQNNYFIKVVKLIGETYGQKYFGKCKVEKYYSHGVKFLQWYLANGPAKQPVSKAQIRRMAYPNYKRMHVIKIPLTLMTILKAVQELVDDNSVACNTCKLEKKKFCQERNKKNILCKDYLLKELLDCLCAYRGRLEPGCKALDILSELDGFTNNCK